LASVAVCVSCQNGRPKRPASSAPTAATRSPASIAVKPWPACAASARATGCGLWPNIAPLSPRQKSA
jgi:hypothetical protein